MNERPSIPGRGHLIAYSMVGAVVGGVMMGGLTAVTGLDREGEYQLDGDKSAITHSFEVAQRSSQEGLDKANRATVSADLQRRDFRISIGEKCLTVLSPYISGGDLSSTSEDSAINDVIGYPQQPCGAIPTEVRRELHHLRADDERVDSAKQDAARNAANLKKVANDISHEDEPLDWRLWGAEGMLAFGGLGAWMHFSDVRHARRRLARNDDI